MIMANRNVQVECAFEVLDIHEILTRCGVQNGDRDHSVWKSNLQYIWFEIASVDFRKLDLLGSFAMEVTSPIERGPFLNGESSCWSGLSMSWLTIAFVDRYEWAHPQQCPIVPKMRLYLELIYVVVIFHHEMTGGLEASGNCIRVVEGLVQGAVHQPEAFPKSVHLAQGDKVGDQFSSLYDV